MKKLLIFLFLTVSFLSFSVGIRPMLFEVNAKPGDTINEEIFLDPEMIDKNVNVELYQFIQNENGEFSFLKADKDVFPEINWINYENKILVPAGKNTISNVKIKVPLNAKPGTYNFILMMTPETVKAKTGISIVMRYAVRISLNVSGISRKKVELKNINIIPDQDKKPTIVATVLNSSDFDLKTSVNAIIRNIKGKIIEKIPLKTAYMMKNSKNEQKILSKNEVQFYGTSKYLVSAGEYRVDVFLNYDDNQKIYTSKIKIPKNVFSFASGKELALKLNPNFLSYKLYPGAAKTSAIRLENFSDFNTKVKVGGAEFPISKDKSMLKWISLKTKNPIILNAGRHTNLITTIRVPKNVEDGAYYGKLLLNSYTKDSTFLTQEIVNCEVLIGNTTTNATVLNYNYKEMNDSGSFSIKIKNTGDRYILPKATLNISNEKRESIGNFGLSSTSESRWLMNGESTILFGDTVKLEKGKYYFSINIYNSDEILTKYSGILDIGEKQ
ncbi:hypothetical protein OSSY52_09260 [Tepiditoga spiralis]|uniref:Uncharacterized protein n=1 Tax=Tepiditoga spiralis TaxID=2108365 RepID=A0A7G1G3Z1_9BACT|nr:hypothetical protein [Tepiditoga spiralis]BBE30785.1 hypothetical protein OSSY52_09260 [Tepiditoga spiralis]